MAASTERRRGRGAATAAAWNLICVHLCPSVALSAFLSFGLIFLSRAETATNAPALAITLSFHTPDESFRAWSPETNRSTNNPSWYITSNVCWSLCCTATVAETNLAAVEFAFSLDAPRWQRLTDWFAAPATNYFEIATLPLATAYFRLRTGP